MFNYFKNVKIRGLSKVPYKRCEVIEAILNNLDISFYSTCHFSKITFCNVSNYYDSLMKSK